VAGPKIQLKDGSQISYDYLALAWKECALVERYRSAGITSIARDFYPGGRHEMLHELNRREVFTNLLVWISGIVGSVSMHVDVVTLSRSSR
jgi:hypothetical protein